MAGHNKWAQIKHQKNITDKKRGLSFSKLLNAISIAAKKETNPDFNPRLRSAIQRAKASNVPNNNIERAITKASDKNLILEELMFEAYGPEGVGLLISVVTDNRNRSVSEIKKVIVDNRGKWATPGSVLWSFEKTGDEWVPRFKHTCSEESRKEIVALIDCLKDREDVYDIFTNTEL